jgi:acetyl-CoA carboxylase biotin carboxyl carrier protein
MSSTAKTGHSLGLTMGLHEWLYFAFDYSHFSEYIKEETGVSDITSPMGGKVIDVKVKPGDTVNENDEVVILEAMKMELPVVATASGKVKEVKCKKGDAVEADAVLIVLG